MLKEPRKKCKPFFWLHIKKAAGQSVRESLKGFYTETDRFNPLPFIAVPRKKWNDTLNNFRIPLGDYDFKRMFFAKKFLYTYKEFSNMFKFTVVRNPYDRAVSSWLYISNYNKKWKLLTKVNKRKSFELFLKRLPEVWKQKKSRHLATHTAPVYPDITDEHGNVLTDFIAKIENIQNDFDYICEKIGIPKRDFAKININKKRKDKNDYMKYYTTKSKRLVEELYKKDFEVLNYSYR